MAVRVHGISLGSIMHRVMSAQSKTKHPDSPPALPSALLYLLLLRRSLKACKRILFLSWDEGKGNKDS